MSSGRTGPYFLLSKSMQKTPKDVPSFGFIPCLGPQAKARESDARFRSPAGTVQIWKQTMIRAESGYATVHRWLKRKFFAKIPRIASATVNTVRLRSVATRTAVARPVGRGFSRGESP